MWKSTNYRYQLRAKLSTRPLTRYLRPVKDILISRHDNYDNYVDDDDDDDGGTKMQQFYFKMVQSRPLFISFRLFHSTQFKYKLR